MTTQIESEIEVLKARLIAAESRIYELEASAGRLRDRVTVVEQRIIREFNTHVVKAVKDAIARGERFIGLAK